LIYKKVDISHILISSETIVRSHFPTSKTIATLFSASNMSFLRVKKHFIYSTDYLNTSIVY
jgi:hypothetical protein